MQVRLIVGLGQNYTEKSVPINFIFLALYRVFFTPKWYALSMKSMT